MGRIRPSQTVFSESDFSADILQVILGLPCCLFPSGVLGTTDSHGRHKFWRYLGLWNVMASINIIQARWNKMVVDPKVAIVCLSWQAHNRCPRVHKNLFGVMVVQMTVPVVKFIFTTFSSDHSGRLLSLYKKDTYTSGVLDLFLPLKNSGKALLSMAWTLQSKTYCPITRNIICQTQLIENVL